jgi:hypothetical protein
LFDAVDAMSKEFWNLPTRSMACFESPKGDRKGTYGFKMSILGDICRPAVFFGFFGHDRQKDAALQDARTFAKTTKPAPPAGLQTSLKCRFEPLARSYTARD